MKESSIYSVILFTALISNAAIGATYDATGRWNFSVTGHRNNCQTLPELNQSGTLVLIQTADTFRLVSESSIRGTLKTTEGTINGAVYEYTDRYQEDHGWTDENTTLTLLSESTGSGSGSWSWSDGGLSCSGSYSFLMTKQSQTTPLYDAAGTWKYTETNFWNNCGDPNPASDSGTINVSQNENRVDATDDRGGTWQGYLSGTEYTIVHSYGEESGITTGICTINLHSASQGSGQCRWPAGLDGQTNVQCKGGSTFAIAKDFGPKPTHETPAGFKPDYGASVRSDDISRAPLHDTSGEAIAPEDLDGGGRDEALVLRNENPATRKIGIIGDSLSSATHTNDACGYGAELPDCLNNALGRHDWDWSHASGTHDWSIASRLGFPQDRIVTLADDGEEWKDALAQAQAITADPDVATIFINLGSNNVCKNLGESYIGDLDLIASHIDDTLSHLTAAMANRPSPEIYWVGIVDLVAFRDLMVNRKRGQYMFTSCQALWDLDAAEITAEAEDSICKWEIGQLCDVIPDDYVEKQVEKYVENWLEKEDADQPCGRILDSSVTPTELDESRLFNIDLNNLMAYKASQWNGINGVTIHYTNALFDVLPQPADISQLDCYHPSRHGQMTLAMKIWEGFYPDFQSSQATLWDDFENRDRCSQEFTSWPGCWVFNSDKGPHTSAFDADITQSGWLKLQKDTNNNNYGWWIRELGDFSGLSRVYAFFNHRRENLDDGSDRVDFEVAQAGIWHRIQSYAGGSNDLGQHNSLYYDLTPYKSGDTQIRFITNNSNGMKSGDRVSFDNITIMGWADAPDPPAMESLCCDGIDNDLDGATDFHDQDCPLQCCKADLDSDGDVDGKDLATFSLNFGRTDCNVGCPGDFDTDGDVDGTDLGVFSGEFGRIDCP